jgi:hypothetical protein
MNAPNCLYNNHGFCTRTWDLLGCNNPYDCSEYEHNSQEEEQEEEQDNV